MQHTIGIYVFDDVEALDFAGPYEVFTTASRMHGRMHPGSPAPFSVVTIAQENRPIRVRAGIRILPDAVIADHPPLDVLIVPGGVVTAEQAKPAVIDWIRRTDAGTALTASVCTGAFLLGDAGLLQGHRVTTHWEDIADLRAQFPDLQVEEDLRWVDAGRIITSAGISAGIDMSLHLVERLAGRALAERTARQLDFDWTENPVDAIS